MQLAEHELLRVAFGVVLFVSAGIATARKLENKRTIKATRSED